MDIQELRIGNYYESTKFGTFVKCEFSDMCEIYQRADGATPDESHVEQLFKPIKLTRKLLLELGFNEYDEGNFIIKIYRQSFIVAEAQDNDLLLQYREDVGLDFYSLQFIDYVHELQNIILDLSKHKFEIKN